LHFRRFGVQLVGFFDLVEFNFLVQFRFQLLIVSGGLCQRFSLFDFLLRVVAF
jgi:hypothetical protein